MTDAEDGPASRRGETVEQAVDAIRNLVISRELFPGQQLRQNDLSLRIGISRGPTREALQALSKEGLVTHTINRGYAVTRLTLADMEQLYKLRDLAESEVLGALPPATKAQIRSLREINRRISNPKASIEEAMRLNRDFHFEIFGISPHRLIVEEIDRWWLMSMAYRALSMGVWSSRAEMMSSAHDEQIQAIIDQDNERLVQLSREHRSVSFQRLENLLG